MNAVKMQLNKITETVQNTYSYTSKYPKLLLLFRSLPLTSHWPFPKTWLGTPTVSFKRKFLAFRRWGRGMEDSLERSLKTFVQKRLCQMDSAEAPAV